MEFLRFYGSLVKSVFEFAPPSLGAKSCHERTFRCGFLLCSNASGILRAHAHILFPISSLYLLRPERLTLTCLVAACISFPTSTFSKQFSELDLIGFLEVIPSGLPNLGTEPTKPPVEWQSNTASASFPQNQCTELPFNHLSTYLGPHPPTSRFPFHSKALHPDAPSGSTSDDRTWSITGIDWLSHEGDQRTYKVSPSVVVEFVVEDQLERLGMRKMPTDAENRSRPVSHRTAIL
jgi:hypothetical protein